MRKYFAFNPLLTYLTGVWQQARMGNTESDQQEQIVSRSQRPSGELDNVPYTKYSQSRPSGNEEETVAGSAVKGIMVVNPHPETSLRRTKPRELQKLENVHRFWPILKSSIEFAQPNDKIADGLDYRQLTSMCQRYQEHLTESANIMGTEQKALASRLKDLEMFTAGIAQQMIRRQERMDRAVTHVEKVNEVAATLEKMQATLDHCVPLVQRLNNLLPEEHRLEPFSLSPEEDPQMMVEDAGLLEEEAQRDDGQRIRTFPPD